MDQWERMEMFYFIIIINLLLLLFCFLGEEIWEEEGEKREERED